MGQTKEEKIIKQVVGAPTIQKRTPIATDMFLPNHSGDHSAGRIKGNRLVSTAAASNIANTVPIWSGTAADTLTTTLITITGDDVLNASEIQTACLTERVEGANVTVFTGTDLDLNSNKILNLATPTAATDGANKSYVDANSGYKTVYKAFYIENPSASDNYPICFVGQAATLNKIWAETDTGTVDFNVEQRSHGAAETAGTNSLAADMQADDDGATATVFDDSALAAESWLFYCSSARVSATKLWIAVKFTYT